MSAGDGFVDTLMYIDAFATMFGTVQLQTLAVQNVKYDVIFASAIGHFLSTIK